MFSISFTELLIILVIALVVIGPKRLPQFARTIGALLGRMKRQVDEVKYQVQSEMRSLDAEQLKEEWREIKASGQEISKSLQTARDSLLAQGSEMDSEWRQANEELNRLDSQGQALLQKKPDQSASPQLTEPATETKTTKVKTASKRKRKTNPSESDEASKVEAVKS